MTTRLVAAGQSRWSALVRPEVVGLLLLVIVAGFFRFRHLGYSEFQGDEARAALLARHLVESGDLGTLLWHKKGPAEILVPALAMWADDLREGTARLPFAVAGFLAVLASLALGRQLWGVRAGWLAAMILAVDGYLIAFSRIVQYQSFVVLLAVLAVWCALLFHRAGRHAGRYLALAGLLIGLGTWAHYEMILVAPAVAWLVLARARAERWSVRQWLRHVALPLALAAGVSAAFYGPFIRHPQFGATAAYIGGRRIGGGLYDMLGDYFARASFYNASYYVMLLAIILTAAVAFRLRRALGRYGTPAAGLWLVAFGLLVLRPGWFQVGDVSLAVLVFLPVLIALLASPTVPAPWQAVGLWLAVPFVVASFLVKKPHTHFYTMMPAAALIVGWTVDRGLGWLEGRVGRRHARLGAAVAGVAVLTVFALHQYVVFIRHDPEYKRVYPAARLPGYWTPFGDELPRGGYFGFPYRAGWNEVRDLFLDGTLHGDYDSNEEALITGWYTWGALRCPDRPRYYLVAWQPQDAEAITLATIQREYHLRATVRVGGQEKLWVWDREPVSGEGGEALVIDDRGGMGSFGGPASPFVERPLPVSQALDLPLPMVARATQLAEGIRLLGADPSGRPGIEVTDEGGPLALAPNDYLGVVLLWSAEQPAATNYSVFVHLVDEAGVTVAQSDGWPGCGHAPTSTWQAGEVVYDPHRLTVPTALSPGTYTLRVGMYDAETGRRLAVVGGSASGEDGTSGDFGGDGRASSKEGPAVAGSGDVVTGAAVELVRFRVGAP